jgi:hypothetical protein
LTSERMHEPNLHVVLASGPLGLAVARHLVARGFRVRAAVRGRRVDLPEGVEVVGADLAIEADVKRAREGAAVVYHCANPPYAKWSELHPPIMDAVIEGLLRLGRGSSLATISTRTARWTARSQKTCPTRREARTAGSVPRSPRRCCGRTDRAGSGPRLGERQTSLVLRSTSRASVIGSSPGQSLGRQLRS